MTRLGFGVLTCPSRRATQRFSNLTSTSSTAPVSPSAGLYLMIQKVAVEWQYTVAHACPLLGLRHPRRATLPQATESSVYDAPLNTLQLFVARPISLFSVAPPPILGATVAWHQAGELVHVSSPHNSACFFPSCGVILLALLVTLPVFFGNRASSSIFLFVRFSYSAWWPPSTHQIRVAHRMREYSIRTDRIAAGASPPESAHPLSPNRCLLRSALPDGQAHHAAHQSASSKLTALHRRCA
ncbi:uncharacterized protein J3D65DRAFT_458199 [Phyllosticta citribraziliensis]|uniref:Uncharacterized protein n=1 Tax=Phyllosticta citribraziliensis TaxID=989973 RepID=A0ABR1LF34_9PEZI